MSEIIWSKFIEPHDSFSDKEYTTYNPHLKVKNVKSFKKETKKLVKLPDRKAYRSMSRASVLLSTIGLEAKDMLNQYLQEDTFSVGIYCAIENGPENYDCVKAVMNIDDEEFAEVYKKNRNPKDYLVQLPNLAPAQLGIFLGAHGPINIYTHSKFACLHAFEQAESDLENEFVKCALVCSAFSLEDALLSLRSQQTSPGKVLSEGAAGTILIKSNQKTNWLNELEKVSGNVNYGITSDIINWMKKGE